MFKYAILNVVISLMKFLPLFFLLAIFSPAHALTYYGVNLAGADFGSDQDGSDLPGSFGTSYTYPNQAEVDYFQGKRFNLVRLPFRWERLQRSLGGDLDAAEMARLTSFVNETTAKGVSVILDPHNYARYNGNLIGSAQVTNEHFADFWTKVAGLFSDNERVIFGLMNEPSRMVTSQWTDAANVAIAAIREAGATNLILVPGNGWTGGHSWKQDWYDDANVPGFDENGYPNGSNAQEMLRIVDSGDNFAFDIHQYLDSDFSGTEEECVDATVGSRSLVGVTEWLETHNKKAILGEFGGGRGATCLAAITDIAQFVEDHPEQWSGWAYWAAGPWWGDYIYTLEPENLGKENVVDRPQMGALESVMQVTSTIEVPGARLDFSARQLRFISVSGLRYQVQRSETLRVSDWSDFGTEVQGTGDEMTMPVSEEFSLEQEFFRLEISE